MEYKLEELKAAEAYFIKRIEHEQPNVNPLLYQCLGEVCFELIRLNEADRRKLL